jgi:hypothetical protein
MLDYLAYMESIKWMQESVRDGEGADPWDGMPARPQAATRMRLRHHLALALRGAAARLEPAAV